MATSVDYLADEESRAQWMARFNKDFKYHPPTDSQVERYMHLRDLGRAFAWAIAQNCPPSREQSLALTHIEEAVMWANAAIARNE